MKIRAKKRNRVQILVKEEGVDEPYLREFRDVEIVQVFKGNKHKEAWDIRPQYSQVMVDGIFVDADYHRDTKVLKLHK